MMAKKKRGRPVGSHPVKVTPEFRETPDIKKMGMVFMAAAKRFMELEQVENAPPGSLQASTTTANAEGDGVP